MCVIRARLARRAAAQRQVKLRRFFQFFRRVDRVEKRFAGHDRPVIGQ
jgi:hypothetical protein